MTQSEGSPTLVGATLFRRAVALYIDLVIGGTFLVPLFMLIMSSDSAQRLMSGGVQEVMAVFYSLLYTMTFAVMVGLPALFKGRSPGQRLMGIHLIDLEGRPPSGARVALRDSPGKGRVQPVLASSPHVPMRRLLFPLAFVALAALATAVHMAQLSATSGSALTARAAASPPAEPGSFPAEWIHGRDCATEPDFQVHWYSENVAILRQGKCSSYEAPFLYLIFGRETILMLDTGANPNAPIAKTVQSVISGWRNRTGNQDAKLLVAHTHTHFDHVAGDEQLAAYTPLAREIGGDLSEARWPQDRRRRWGSRDAEELADGEVPPPSAFELWWGFEDFPHDTPTLDLGGRVLDVLGVPGHDENSVALYDRRTQLLLTGDIVYPGHLFVFSDRAWPKFVASITRLVDWAATHPVSHVVGCHVETRAEPGRPFAYGTEVQPGEHPLQLPPTILPEILTAARAQVDFLLVELDRWAAGQ